jgi:hypothetical protein
MLFKSHILVGSEGKEVPAHAMQLYDLCFLPNKSLGDQIKKKDLGGACSAYGGQERFMQGFGGET